MKKEFSESSLSKIAILKVFSSMDTQSAIVAAVVISAMTFLGAGFINLCNYIYWSAYFTKFNIPLAYMEEAIIHENGSKYIAILLIPAVVFVWWLLQTIKKSCIDLVHSMRKKHKKQMDGSDRSLGVDILRWCMLFVFGLLVVTGFVFVLGKGSEPQYRIYAVFGGEFAIFLFWTISQDTLGRKFSLSKKKYYMLRGVGVFITLYLILGGVYYSGSFENYSRNGAQSIQVVYDPEMNYYTLNGQEKIEAQMVLLETVDYYYVTDVTITNAGSLNVQIWGDDSYRFIDKIQCPVKSIYAHLSYIGGGYQESVLSQIFVPYVIGSIGFVVVFISLLGIPQRKEEQSLAE